MSIESLFPSQPGASDPIAKASPLWRGQIAETAESATDAVRVKLHGADNGQHLHGPCTFLPRGVALPSAGDECLVAFDDDGDPWIVAWASDASIDGTQIPTVAQKAALDAASPALSGSNPVVAAEASVRVTSRMPLLRTGATVMTRFQPGHGWSGTNVAANDTDQYLYGSQSVKMTSVNAAVAQLNSPNSLNIDTTDKAVWAMVYCDDWAALNNISIYVANDNSFAAYYNGYIQPTVEFGGWRFIEFPWDRLTTTAGSPTRTGVNKLRFRVVSVAGETVNAWIGAVGLRAVNDYANGVVSFTFDDSLRSPYTLGLPILSKYGYPATAYLIADAVDSSDSYLTSEQCYELIERHGWEMGAHAATVETHVDWSGYSDSALVNEFTALKSALAGKGLGAANLATPYGAMSDEITRVGRQFFDSVREVTGTSAAIPKQYAPGQHECIHAFSFDASTVPVATITALMDTAAAQGYWLPLVFHAITAAASSGGSCSTSDFTTVVDYAYNLGMEVKTVAEVLATS